MFGVFLSQKFHNKPLTIVGNGKQEDYHVTDLVSAIDKVIKRNKTNFFEYNVGYGKTAKVIDIARMISNKLVFIPNVQESQI